MSIAEKTEEELRKELDKLNRQQWEITERLRDPRGIRRGGLSGPGPRNFSANGVRQRGFVRPITGDSTYLIKVELLAAKNIIAANLNGTSHPYAMITCGVEKRFSSMIPSSRNPMWGEEFNFSIDNLPTQVCLHIKTIRRAANSSRALNRRRISEKMVGTALCIIGVVSMALLKGPKLLNSDQIPQSLLISYGSVGRHSADHDHWLLGCLYLLGSNFLWSIWLILQIPLTASHPDLISLTAWMCFLGTLQSAVVASFLEPNIEAWRINSNIELFACLFAGIVGSAFSFFVQAWYISQKGPLFSVMFNPFGTVIVSVFASTMERVAAAVMGKL